MSNLTAGVLWVLAPSLCCEGSGGVSSIRPAADHHHPHPTPSQRWMRTAETHSPCRDSHTGILEVFSLKQLLNSSLKLISIGSARCFVTT